MDLGGECAAPGDPSGVNFSVLFCSTQLPSRGPSTAMRQNAFDLQFRLQLIPTPTAHFEATGVSARRRLTVREPRGASFSWAAIADSRDQPHCHIQFFILLMPSPIWATLPLYVGEQNIELSRPADHRTAAAALPSVGSTFLTYPTGTASTTCLVCHSNGAAASFRKRETVIVLKFSHHSIPILTTLSGRNKKPPSRVEPTVRETTGLRHRRAAIADGSRATLH